MHETVPRRRNNGLVTWLKIDDRFFDNPKIIKLSDAAVVAYLKAATYCAGELTDGFVPEKRAKEYAGSRRVLVELVPCLWEPCLDGIMVHDYLKYNPTRAQVEEERAKARARFARTSGEDRAKNNGSSREL